MPDGPTLYAIGYVCVAIPAAMWGLWRASLIPPTWTPDDDIDGERAPHQGANQSDRSVTEETGQ